MPEEELLIITELPEIMDIPMQEGVAGSMLYNTAIPHTQSDPNQHTIEAITGLRAELDALHHQVDDTTKRCGIAEYYQWRDGGDSGENRIGYFVRMLGGTGQIALCNIDTEVLGVTTDQNMLIGNIGYANDPCYALVGLVGTFDVREDGTCQVGNHVVPNAYGVATPSGNRYGYTVVAKGINRNFSYVTITIATQNDVIRRLGQDIASYNVSIATLNQNVDAVSDNASLAMIMAQTASNQANTAVTNLNNFTIDTRAQLTVLNNQYTALQTSTQQALETAGNAITNAIVANNLSNNIATATEAGLSSISLLVDNGVVKGEVIAEAINNQSTVTINADKINLTGYITASSLNESGTTSIHGSRIITGSITATQIDATNLRVSAANITGSLTVGNLFSANINSPAVTLAGFTATSQALYNGRSSIDSDVQGIYIGTDGICMSNGSGWSGDITKIVSGKMFTQSLYGACYNIQADGITQASNTTCRILWAHSSIGSLSELVIGDDTADTTTWLRIRLVNPARFDGTATFNGNVLSAGGVTQFTSDRRLKYDITTMDERWDDVFDRLKPSEFKFTSGSSGRTHTGLIAQEVEEAVLTSGLTSQDTGLYCIDADGTYYVRYDELIPINIWQIQKLKAEVQALQERLTALENK